MDNTEGALLATRHLISLGHRRIAFSGSLRLTDFRERLSGYHRALVQANLSPQRELEITNEADWSFDAAVVLQRLQAAGATAVVCATDAHALTLVRRAPREEIRIPEDLSVIGFDDVPAAGLSSPPLTTVHLPALTVGQMAVQKLMELLNGADPAHCRSTLPVELRLRRSTSPPGRPAAA